MNTNVYSGVKMNWLHQAEGKIIIKRGADMQEIKPNLGKDTWLFIAADAFHKNAHKYRFINDKNFNVTGCVWTEF